MNKFAMLMAAFAPFACSDKFETVATDRFAEIITDKNVQLIDVRTADEYSEGYIQGAVLIDVMRDDFLEKALSKLDKSRPVAVYCRSGKRSASASALLSANGFSKIYNLDGGIIDWIEDGQPIVND